MVKKGGVDSNQHSVNEPIEGERLLSLLLKVSRIRLKDATRILETDEPTMTEWANALEKDEWIKPRDRQVPNPLLEISPLAGKKVDEIRKGLAVEEEKQKKQVPRRSPREILAKIDKAILLDALILLSTIVSLLLLRNFLLDPNRESLSFLFAVMLFFSVTLTYRSYEEITKTRKIITVFGIMLRTLVRIVKVRKVHIFATVALLVLMYSAGNIYLTRKTRYAALAVLSLTTYLLLYHPKKTRREYLMFYAGMLLLAGSLLLLMGSISIAEYVLKTRFRLVDVSLGIILLSLLRLKESYFGVGPNSFKEMTRKA